jgi:hypothetical protein
MTDHQKLLICNGLEKRRARDSNPQPVSRHLISSQAANHSLTLQGDRCTAENGPSLAVRFHQMKSLASRERAFTNGPSANRALLKF